MELQLFLINFIKVVINLDWQFILKVFIRCMLSVVIGGLIGSERAKHGRAAGMRTHILVCLGAALTAMIGVYVSEVTGNGGDVLRISAQVISGIGFLGAGMIILKDNNIITGLTTAAGVWTTSIIGIAIGYGFYSGAVIAAVIFLVAIIFLSKLEKGKRNTEIFYIEIDDMSKTNEIISAIKSMTKTKMHHNIEPPRSSCEGHLGISFISDKKIDFDIHKLREIENVLFID